MKTPSLSATLLTNTATSALAGILLLTLPAPIGEFMGGVALWLLRLVGAGLLMFALGVHLVNRGLPTTGRWVTTVLLFDIAWILATPVVMLVFAQQLSIWGHLLLAEVALIVTAFASLEWHWLKRIKNGSVAA